MKKRQLKIKSFVNELKNNQQWYFITIVFDNTTYFRRLNNINDFYKLLSNSKSSLTGHPSNRLWWKRIVPSGIYEPLLTDENLILNFILVPQLGILGAAISTLLTFNIVFFMYMRFSQKFYYVPHNQ